MLSFTFFAEAETKPKVKIVIKTDIKGKGGATGSTSGVSLCPIDAQAVCATLTTTIEIGGSMTVSPGTVVPLGGSEGIAEFPDGSIKNIRILEPSYANVGDDGEVNIQGSEVLVEYLD